MIEQVAALKLSSRAIWGGVWGTTIFGISVLLAGAGHGVFALLGLFSAPISLLGVTAAWLSCVPLGAALAICAPRREFPAVALVHYLAVIAVMTLTEFADWQQLSVLPTEYAVAFFVGLGVYIVGQVFLWRVWVAAGGFRRPPVAIT